MGVTADGVTADLQRFAAEEGPRPEDADFAAMAEAVSAMADLLAQAGPDVDADEILGTMVTDLCCDSSAVAANQVGGDGAQEAAISDAEARASGINNDGRRAQLAFLAAALGPAEAPRALAAELPAATAAPRPM